MSIDVVERARGLIGTRFRAQGRDPDSGVDCLGLAIVAFDLDGHTIRRDYRLSGEHRRELTNGLERLFRRVAKPPIRAGDLMLMRIAERHYHLAIRTDAGFVHADARRGVVETPGTPSWPVIASYRRRVRPQRGQG